MDMCNYRILSRPLFEHSLELFVIQVPYICRWLKRDHVQLYLPPMSLPRHLFRYKCNSQGLYSDLQEILKTSLTFNAVKSMQSRALCPT